MTPYCWSRLCGTPLNKCRTAPGTRLLCQRAATLGRDWERLVAGHHRKFLVVIPRLLRFRRLLNLEQIEIVHEAPVGQYLALRKQIVDRKLLQLRRDRLSVLGAGRLHGLQILQRRGVGTSLDHVRHSTGTLEEA